MRLMTMTDYAMRLLMYLGQRPGSLCTISEIASAYGISEGHMMKLTHKLGLHGWIETVRGKGGGIRLAHAPETIRLGDVVRCIENDFYLVECFASGSTCTLTGHCQLTEVMHSALDSFLNRLDDYTLADILQPRAPQRGARVVAMPVSRRPGPRAG